METVGAFEAKTHLSALLERVAKGEAFTITRHGKPVAQLVPVERRDPDRVRSAIERMKTIAAGQTLAGDWREFRDAGRKW
ncbi:MAG TPA: type II toxin-antitoxin system prevent-host-death family antitoxin [Acetobacteraceae bacterium]|jgi:prevent-host-death family protein